VARRCARRRQRSAPCPYGNARAGRRCDQTYNRSRSSAGLSGRGWRVSAIAARLRPDPALLLVAPAVVFLLLFFIYPFGYGFVLSFTPIEGDWLANYRKFFSDEHLWRTVIITFQLSLPVTILNVGLALPIAFQ